MKGLINFCLVGLLSLALSPAMAQQRGLGDPAPKFQVSRFAKGAPVKSLAPGNVYVVEFWATWCGPCRETIPHLTKLQKQFPKVTFIGVSILEENQSAVDPFVREMGAKMDYRVALDLVPKGKSGEEGAMALAWMKDTGTSGIPNAFIVNREGKLAWIGHPAEMDEPLSKVVQNTWDLRAAVAKQNKQRKAERTLQALQGKLKAAEKAKSPKQALVAVEQALAAEPSLESTLGMLKFAILVQLGGDPGKTAAYGTRLVNSVYSSDPRALMQLAGQLAAPGTPPRSPKILQVALMAALKADQITEGAIPGIAHTLARCYFLTGNKPKAVTTQERAVRLGQGSKEAPDLQRALDDYRKAAGSRR